MRDGLLCRDPRPERHNQSGKNSQVQSAQPLLIGDHFHLRGPMSFDFASDYHTQAPVRSHGNASRPPFTWIGRATRDISVRRRATFIIAAGRIYAPGSPNADKNYFVPWLCTVFGSLGMSDMHFVIAEGTKKVHSRDLDRATFLVPHLEAIRALSPTNSIQWRSRLRGASNCHIEFG